MYVALFLQNATRERNQYNRSYPNIQFVDGDWKLGLEVCCRSRKSGLNSGNMKTRLEWVLSYIDSTVEDWKIIWSDESSIWIEVNGRSVGRCDRFDFKVCQEDIQKCIS